MTALLASLYPLMDIRLVFRQTLSPAWNRRDNTSVAKANRRGRGATSEEECLTVRAMKTPWSGLTQAGEVNTFPALSSICRESAP